MSTLVQAEYYNTWPEASAVCIANEISSAHDYDLRRKRIDPKLPARPSDHFVKAWPGWKTFLGK